MLIQAIDILSQKYNIYLDIYSEINYTLQYYHNLLINKSAVRFIAPIVNFETNIYNLYDIVLLPSVSEGCSLNVLESINNEIPIVCSKNIGNYEIINDDLPMFELNGLSIYDSNIYVCNYNKLLEGIGYCFEPNNIGLDILIPNINNSEKFILYNNNLNEIINKIEYTLNNYDKVKQNTINLKNKITNKFFNISSYILKLNTLLNPTKIFINRSVIAINK
jgi:glycosyltransferase involved in cell wall biosynthesis